MEVRQLNLWDNVAAETGFQQLMELKFQEAAKSFLEAQNSPVQIDPAVMAGKRACSFWEQQIGAWQVDYDPKTLTPTIIKNLLDTYQQYSFKWLNNFSVHLLEYIASLAQQSFRNFRPAVVHCPEDGYANMVILIELLNQESNLNTKVPDCLNALIEVYPRDGRLPYLLADSYYRTGEKAAAKLIYAESLIKYPLDIPENYQFPEELDLLIQRYGPGKAAIYAAIEGILPCPTIEPALNFDDETHQLSLDCYRLYRQAELTYKTQDLKTSIKCRKELMRLDKALCECYLISIRKRETRSSNHSN